MGYDNYPNLMPWKSCQTPAQSPGLPALHIHLSIKTEYYPKNCSDTSCINRTSLQRLYIEQFLIMIIKQLYNVQVFRNWSSTTRRFSHYIWQSCAIRQSNGISKYNSDFLIPSSFKWTYNFYVAHAKQNLTREVY